MTNSVQPGPGLTLAHGDPATCCQQWRADCQGAGAQLLLVEFELQQTWLDNAPAIPLTALYCLEQGRLRMAITDQPLRRDACSPRGQFERWLARHELLAVTEGDELELQPTVVAKPWGREIWYSGVEQRGVCAVAREQARLPLPWLRAAMPDDQFGAGQKPLLLLKVLDPSPETVTGDLYFELHEDKREAYIVKRIDAQAWPDGVGYIRYGFCPQKRARWPDDYSFRRAYLEAVRNYEGVRRHIDKLLQQNLSPSQELVQHERESRAEMDSFTWLRPLRKGEVVAVPPLLPHALQHGVSTIEFQTPVYERKILSFAQRVLTQEHWDTAQVLPQMLLAAPPAPPVRRLACAPGLLVERIIDYPDFEVQRATLDGDAQWRPEVLPGYALLMVFEGSLVLRGVQYEAGQALLLPRSWQQRLGSADPAQPLVLLLALPRA